MAYFKVVAEAQSLPMYTQASSKEAAIQRVESLVGPLNRKQVRTVEVAQNLIPEGESLI